MCPASPRQREIPAPAATRACGRIREWGCAGLLGAWKFCGEEPLLFHWIMAAPSGHSYNPQIGCSCARRARRFLRIGCSCARRARRFLRIGCSCARRARRFMRSGCSYARRARRFCGSVVAAPVGRGGFGGSFAAGTARQGRRVSGDPFLPGRAPARARAVLGPESPRARSCQSAELPCAPPPPSRPMPRDSPPRPALGCPPEITPP